MVILGSMKCSSEHFREEWKEIQMTTATLTCTRATQSCQHLLPAQGYKKAKYLLKEPLGNEEKIATIYMD
jgi:hypothetical protein